MSRRSINKAAHSVKADLLYTKYGDPSAIRHIDRQMKEDVYRSFGGHVPVEDEDAGSGCVGSAEGDVEAGLGSGSESESSAGMSDKMQSCDVGSFVEGTEGTSHDSNVGSE